MSPLSLRTLQTLLLGLLVASPLAAAPSTSASALCNDCPRRVPDGGAAAGVPQRLTTAASLVPLSCAGAAPVGGIEVRVDLLHNHIGDVDLRLIGPDATVYPLLPRLSDAALSCAGEDIKASFVGGVEGAVAPACGVFIPVVGGLIQTASPTFDALAATPIPGGNWTLDIGDHAAGNEGLLLGWQFHVYCQKYGVVFADPFED